MCAAGSGIWSPAVVWPRRGGYAVNARLFRAPDTGDGVLPETSWIGGGTRRRWPFARLGFGDHLFASRPESLILVCRLITSSLGLLAVWLDPTAPARNVTETYVVLTAYVLFSAALWIRPSHRPLNHPSHIFTHAVDILVLCVLAFMSGELASPFYAYFTFALMTGAMRWGVRGALITAVILDVLLVPVGWPYGDPGSSDLNLLIMRSVYALVAAIMLGYFASHRERSRRRLAQLAAWPVESASDEGDEPGIAGSLQHASTVLGGAELLVLWRDEDEPLGRLAWWDGMQCNILSLPSEICQHPIDAGKTHAAFHGETLLSVLALPAAIENQLPHSLKLAGARLKRYPSFCSARLSSPRHSGRVFVIHASPPSEDVLSLTDIVAAHIAAEIEQSVLMRELEVTASLRERGRLARDLHDSVLQDLTAASLQLKTASQNAPETVRSAVVQVSGILFDQQRRIRRFVEEARSFPAPAFARPLEAQLRLLADALSRQWHCAVTVEVDPPGAELAAHALAGLCQIVSEATANAVRHGAATHVDVAVNLASDHVEVAIDDDGRGLPAIADGPPVRPRSISERVADLGGGLTIRESGRGLSMIIRLPL